MKTVLREVVETVVLAVLILAVFNLAIDRRHVEGPSMQPTLHAGQLLLANKLAYSPLVSSAFATHDADSTYDHPGTPHRGDIVILKRPGQPDGDNLVKRVVALPGEQIEIRNGVTYVNGQPLDEPYVVNHDRYSMPPQTVPSGRVFVMGDNRPNSNDSRAFGPVSISDLVGRVWLRYWPLAEAGVLSAP